jgi:hypothetical protein
MKMRLAYVTVAVLVLSIASVEAAAQSPPPPPGYAQSAQTQAPTKISDAFAKAELLALEKVEEDFTDSLGPSLCQAVFDLADAEAVTLQEILINAHMRVICDDKFMSYKTIKLMKDFPTTVKMQNAIFSRINTCIQAEKDALRKRSAKFPSVCEHDVIYVPATKEEMAAVEKESDVTRRAGSTADAPAKPTFDPNAPYSVRPPPAQPAQPARQAKQQSPSRLAPSRKDIPTIAKAANGAIVTIVMANDDKPFALGSGFLVSPEGVIVTNYHVIAEGNVAIVKFPDGTALPVDGVLAADKVRDLAIIKIHGKSFRTLDLGNSDQVRVGEEVVAIGNPLGLELTVSNGILSGVRTVEKEGGKFLQVTAPISHGSSGGPLFNMHGEVVGINTMSYEGGENLNFAIPVNDAKILLSNQSTKLQNLPNETEPVKAQTQSGDAPPSVSVPAPQTTPGARDYYQQLYNAGGFSNGLPNAVCFSDDAHSGTFFTFVAYAYDKDYYDAQAKLPTFEQTQAAGSPGVTSEQMTQFKIMERVQRTAPYVSFLMKGWFETFPREAQQFFRSGGRVLDETIYEKGVKVNTIEYRWDGSSWYISIPPADPNAYTKTLKILRLAIEPTSMRYVDSTTVTMTVGSGATAATHTDRYGPWGGVCEKVPNPK